MASASGRTFKPTVRNSGQPLPLGRFSILMLLLFIQLPKFAYGRSLLTEDAQPFARNFGLRAWDPSSLRSDADDAQNSFVDHGSIVLFLNNVKAQSQSDVLESTLLGQLAADHKYNRFSNPKEWYSFYSDVLGKIAWVVQHIQSFEKYQPKKESFTLSDVVMEQGKSAASEEVAKIITKLQENKDALQLLQQNIYSQKNGNFQLLLCSDENETLTVALFGFYFTMSQSSNKGFPLYPSTKDSIELYISSQSIILNESIYSRVRKEIKNKLKGKYKPNVHAI